VSLLRIEVVRFASNRLIFVTCNLADPTSAAPALQQLSPYNADIQYLEFTTALSFLYLRMFLRVLRN